MKFHLLTIFPQFFEGPLQYGVVARAAEAGALELNVHDLRNWTHDLHRTVDDRPFGGGAGMLLKPEPIFDAVEDDLAVAYRETEGDPALSAGAEVQSADRAGAAGQR